MARTKKQTLVNACERRRQIQEEIRRETCAARQKREGFSSVGNVHSAHNGVPIANLPTVTHLEKMDNGTEVSSDGETANCCQALNTGSQGTMSSVTHAASEASLYNEGNLPKAVICIPDICKSPTKLAAEEPAVQEQSSKGPGLWGKTSPHSHSVKPREESRKCSSLKQFEKNGEDDVIASLRSLKAVSEKVREEKSRKSRQAPYAVIQSSGSGRRSPRQSSLLPSDASPSYKSVSRKGLKDATSSIDEKPKVNIFTDNLGKDLGKRVRSPRRLSEDMIALPIFSARRWSNSPKDSSAASYSGGRSPDEISIYDGMETLSLHTPQKRESFKSDSPIRNKQSGFCESFKKSSLTGSSKFNLCEKGSTSTRNFAEPHEQHDVQSDNNSPSTGITSTNLVHEKCNNAVNKQESLCEDTILQTFHLKHSKPGLLLSDKMRTLAQNDSDVILSQSNSVPHDTSVIDDSVGGSWKTGSASTSFPIKENRSKHKTQEDADNQKSSTCKELMSTGMLIKCENRCLNDTVDSFDAKTDISDEMDLSGELNKSIKGFKNIIDVTINSSQVREDPEKETNRSKCPSQTSALPLEMGEDKPQSSLLCAMLVGGTEVAHSYNQERVRVKSQGGDKSDSELDTVKCDSSHLVSSSLLPQQSGEPADVTHKLGLKTVDSERSDNQDSQGLLVDETAEELLSCGKVTADENTDAVTGICEPVVSVKVQDDSEITDESIAVVETEPVHFYKKLKQVNESVLKLIDIDVEKECLQELEVDDSGSHGNVEDRQSDSLAQSEQCQSALYSLISSLGTRLQLQCADSQIPFSTPVDIELVGKLIESCPKNAPDIIPRLKTATRKKLLNKRMEEENVKDTIHIQNLATEKELCAGGDKNDGGCVIDPGNASATTSGTDLHAEKDNSQTVTGDTNCADMQITSTETMQKMDLDTGSSNMCLPVTYLEDPSSCTEADSANVPESIDQNANAKESAVMGFSDLNTGVEKNTPYKCSEVLQATTSTNSVMPADFSTRKVTEATTRLSFQKSKTCDDFNERLSTNSVSHAGTLRRVNSSPQMNTKQVIPSLSSLSLFNSTTKDSHTKSKLGSKIPIPGTSYVTKSKRSWRIPRTIVEPKPLSVLSDLEQSSSQPTSAFVCPDLQKYLNVPSNRVIVTADKQEEMQILDAQAKEQEELDEKMMDDKDKNLDDDTCLDYKNFEPDFDEVDGMLFMSFFSEIELRAHVRVEKALEWDKDDTMLRVSRAKAFEEAKSQKEDMGHYKLKHLRGQHMRWKKYRRMYSNEVKALMEAQITEQSQDSTPVTKKTSDLSKIKGWKRKNASMPDIGSDVNDNFNWSFDTKNNISFNGHKNEVAQCFSPPVFEDSMFDDSVYFTSENMMADDSDKPQVSSRSRRRQGFSHQKAHRQLFRELHMDWEDRMIHRKLGGWSLKGNRPQAYSSAAKKRQERKSKEVESGCFELKDNIEAGSFEETELETTEVKDHNEDSKKKRTIKIIYPLLTEKMARNALKTLLETGDIQRGVKRKKIKARQSLKQPPALAHLICKSEPDDETASTQLISPAGLVLSAATTLLTPSAASSFTSLSSPSTSVATVSQEIDLQDDPVMEGVDIAAENISSPSVTDTSSMKSCGKPGCRYGCICHLCSVNESSTPLPSLLSKQPAPACDKEYCRLGCICDSIDHERLIPSKTHCGRPSCMLQCVCLETGSYDGNEDIPYLPSMRRRPKPGDRFSNLPQREKTHRSAKNLDAVTRKAMMLYETSEIYCERVERTRKRSDMATSPASSSFDTSLLGATVPTSSSSAAFDIDSVSDPSEDGSFPADTFSADVPIASETMGSTPSHPFIIFNTSPQHQHQTRNIGRVSKPAFILDDVRQTFSIMEPSAHKRKRKSHPLSDEIFISSTCARTQPFKLFNACKGMRAAVTSKDSEEVIEVSSCVSVDSTCPVSSTTLLPLPCKPVDVKLTDTDHDSKEMIPKISSVHTLASEGKDVQQWENAESETPLSHSVVTSDSVSHQRLQNMTTLQQTSAQTSISNAGSQRQFHGWHKSMVCLKARSQPTSQDPGEDDVKEEDEVKLLEFTANCNWEVAKRAILAKVAQCLTRGQYPQPRTMNVSEFVVEILPKAHQPSHIPAELRAKLPGQMYSIRVRITRRESLIKKEDDSDVIDLSGSPSVKSESGIDNIDSSLKESPFTLADQKPGRSTSDSTFLTSNSVGISGLSKLFITSPPVSGQPQNSSNEYQNLHSSQTGSGHNFQRQSLESALVFSSSEYNQATGHHTMTVQSSLGHKPKASTFLRFGNSASQKTVGSALSSESIKTETGTTLTSSLKMTKNVTSKKLKIKALNISKTNDPFASKPGSSGVTPIFGPFNANDVKYMMSAKEGAMQLIEIAPTGDKNKKLIAVPITLSKASADLKGQQSAVVALPVSGMGQSRILPVLSPPTASSQLKTTAAQQIMLRLPSAQASPGVRHPVVLQPVLNSVKCHPSRFQVVPLQVSNSLTLQPKVMPASAAAADTTTVSTVQSCTGTSVTQKPVNSSDEMIMVFDAAHIKASQAPISSVVCAASVSTHDKEQKSECVDHSASIVPSDNRLEIFTNTATDQQNDKDVTQAFAVEKAPLKEDVLLDKRIENVLDDCDNVTSSKCEHLIKKYGHVDLGDGIESVLQGDCNGSLYTGDTDVLDGQPNQDEHLPEASVESKVSVDNTIDINCDTSVKEENLVADSLVKTVLSENASTKRKNFSSIFSNSPISFKEHIPRTLQEFAMTGSKRRISAMVGLEDPLSPAMKKPYLAVENPIVLDEDSMTSLNSVSGLQQAAASPLSSVDRPKSVMSGALSTGSSEDMLILLSSEEDIDVGEDDKPDDIISHRVRVERALQNDHGSMYARADPVAGASQSSLRSTQSLDDIVRQYGVNPEDMSRATSKELQRQKFKDLQKVNHHNQLERLRRSRMKTLFDELQEHVLKERQLPRDHVMSKVKVLAEAKKVVLHLSKCVLDGNEQVKRYERKNKSLQNKLAALKGNLMQQKISIATISRVTQRASNNFLLQSINTNNSDIEQPPEDIHNALPSSEVMHPVTADRDIEDSQEMVNLVSPSTDGDGDRVSERSDVTTPVYEDISDPEVALMHTFKFEVTED